MPTRLLHPLLLCFGLVIACALAMPSPVLARPADEPAASATQDGVLPWRRKRARVQDAPATGVVLLEPGVRERIRVDRDSPRRKFAKETTRYRLVELSRTYKHVAVRIQVMAQPQERGRGNNVIRPMLHVLDDDDSVRQSVRPEPLHLDIRPFKRTRLLGCVTLDDVRRFAIAADARAVGENHESNMRSAVRAPTRHGFHYATGSVKVYLPYVSTGEVIIEVRPQEKSGAGC